MKNFKNYMYCNSEHQTYAKVYHNKELKECVFTDGRFMIISKELFDDSKDVEYLKKNAYNDFDYHSFDYRKVLYPKDDLVEVDCRLFRSEVYLANETLFNKELSYKDALDNKVYFKDFDFVLSVPIIHVVNEFFNDNKNLETKLYVNKEDITKNIMIEVYSGDILNDDVLNMMLFMPIASNSDYQVTIENNELSHKGIELVPRIPIENLKWVFKCNQRLRGKEWKKVNFMWGVKKVFRNLQKKFFYEKWVIWHNYTLMGNSLNNIMDLSERYYTVDEIIRMIEMWSDECIEWNKNKEEDK